AEMHAALLRNPEDAAFAPEPFNDFYRQSLFHGYIALTARRLEFIRQRYADMSAEVRLLAAKVLEQESAINEKFRTVFDQRIPSQRTRFHGRLHLGHLLVTADGGRAGDLASSDVVLFDFEGDPTQHISERRIKRCPLRDVASMLVSFGYAAQSAVRVIMADEVSNALPRQALRVWGRFWYSHISAAYIRGYWSVANNASYMPPSRPQQEILLQSYLLERALLDVREDIEDKPEFSGMPFRLILHLLDAEAERRLGE
ncbi:MAG: hypothetical protein JOZ62_00440, partial [Acidobacteriaceae bacterium]|nr:hypothetical protein [Acidobacteriaceae bacterium]